MARGAICSNRGRKVAGFLDTHDLSDVWRTIHPDEKRYTSFGTGYMTRIDLALASPAMLTHIQNSTIGTAYITDHAPVYVKLGLDKNVRGRGYWRIPTYLLADSVYTKRIENTIDESIEDAKSLSPDTRLDFVKSAIRGNSIQYVSEENRKKNAWVKEISVDINNVAKAREMSRNSPEVVRAYTQQLKLLQIERDELIMNYTERSLKFNVAQKHYESNRSTKYYFQLPGCKYDSTKRFQLDSGETITGTEAILEHSKQFYENLYNKEPHKEANSEDLKWEFLQHIPPSFLSKQYQALSQPLTLTELRNSLGMMKKNTSPGADGLTVEFYLHFWNQMGPLLLSAFNYNLQKGCMSDSQRLGLIRLIPKKDKNPLLVKNWRPITLLPVCYKILSKTLAYRLAAILPDIIDKDQRGFVKGRYIGENIMALYSIISQAEQDDEGMIMFLDIEKAFDSVSWNYLYEVLNNFNLPDEFIRWIKTLYARKELKILNNGYMSGTIFPQNGLAQGNGLSPLLFILTIETLAISIRKNDKIQGYKIGSIHKKLALLADDMILSLKA